MSEDFLTIADDFFVNMTVHTTLALPGGRETVLHFCEAVQKEFPDMTSFFQREGAEFVLEGDRDAGSYRWLELHNNQLSAGHFNPPQVAAAYQYHRWLLDRSVYFLGLSGLDVECMDVMMGFNMDYKGNRDAIVASALVGGAPLAGLWADAGVRVVECEPSLVIALDEECHMQARLSLETRGSSYQVRTGQYDDEPISVYLTVRRYPTPGKLFDAKKSFSEQAAACEELTTRVVVPQVIQPLAAAIASGQ
ncbi:MAG TPA: hypothetical protein DCX07_04645 [Phycisphaerales bacterium]|nr:hypothetical protein [Phycisphaerales bacterium]